MSLLGWLGSTKKVDPRSLSPTLKRGTAVYSEPTVAKITTQMPDRMVLGVLGTRSNIRYEDLDSQIMSPLVTAWGEPMEILIPADGDSSYAIESWATRRKIPVTLVGADWKSQGRKAGMLRDAKIQREATHLLLLQGPRSNALSNLGARLSRKGRPVVISERPGQEIKPIG
jgi:hypothetical protein